MSMTVPNGYKQTKVGVIPEEWEVVKLGEIYPQIRNGFVGVATPFYVKNGVKYLQGKNIKDGNINNINLVYVSQEFHEKNKKSQLKINDIVMVQSGHVGECAVITEEYHNSNCHALLILSPKPNVSSEFYAYLFNANMGRRIIYKIITGNTIKHILSSDTKILVVPLPPLKEQQKIAQILTTWDDAISKQEALIEAKEQLKKGLMQKLLSGEVRFAGFDGEWEEVRLGDIATFYKGKGISKNDISDKGIECIRYGELYTKYGEKIEKVFSKTSVNKNDLFLSKENDILIPASGETAIDIATASCVTKDGIALSGDINVIRTNENGIFLSYYLNVIAKTKIASLAQGISVIHLYQSQLKSLKIKLPPKKEQQKIAQVLTTADKEIVLLKEELESLKEQKRGLMQKLLTGEVRVRYE